MKSLSLSIVVALTLCYYGAVTQQISFQESSLDSGLEQVVVSSDLMGGGVAIFDYNADGWQDLFLIGGLRKSKLFKNLGKGIFMDATDEAGGFERTGALRTMGVVTGDLDNDGFPEILISTGRDLPSIVYKNNGDGTFSEITPQTGINTTYYTIPIVLGDYNLDGLLDVYMINYIQTPKSTFDSQGGVIGFEHKCYPNQLFVNNANLQFTEMAESLGIDDKGCGLGGLFTDIDGDYLPDIYIANDFGEWTGWPNAFYKNSYPKNSFANKGEQAQLNAAIYGMGIAQGDINNDGLLDLYVTNMGRNVLYKNNDNTRFEDITDQALVGNAKTNLGLYNVGWGTSFLDPDNDANEDLFVSYGYVPGSKIIETSWVSEDKFYRNSGSLPFQDISSEIGLNDKDFSRGMAVGDLDNDGDEDIIATKLIVTSSGRKPNVMYYVNTTESTNRWLQVSLRGTTANRDALGTTIKAYADNLTKVKALSGGGSHASQSSNVVHFGLGQHTLIASVEIFWPGGKHQVFKDIPTNKHILIEEDVPTYETLGCIDPLADNFDATATKNYGCFYKRLGCTNPTFDNYDATANINDGSCRVELVTSLEEAGESILNVYPNPFQDRLNISLIKDGVHRLEIINVNGQLASTLTFNEMEAIWYPEIPKGIYLFRIYTDNILVSEGKIIRD